MSVQVSIKMTVNGFDDLRSAVTEAAGSAKEKAGQYWEAGKKAEAAEWDTKADRWLNLLKNALN